MAKGVKIQIEGMKELRDAVAKNSDGLAVALGQALHDAAIEISNESQELVPQDTGMLKASMFLKPPTSRTLPQNMPVISINYGEPYALIQHERLDFFHPPKPPGKSKVGGRQGIGTVAPGSGRGPKYLEFPFVQETSLYPAKLVERIRARYHIEKGKNV